MISNQICSAFWMNSMLMEFFPKGGNASFLALIPKVHDSQSLNEYGPISLIGRCV